LTRPNFTRSGGGGRCGKLSGQEDVITPEIVDFISFFYFQMSGKRAHSAISTVRHDEERAYGKGPSAGPDTCSSKGVTFT